MGNCVLDPFMIQPKTHPTHPFATPRHMDKKTLSQALVPCEALIMSHGLSFASSILDFSWFISYWFTNLVISFLKLYKRKLKKNLKKKP